MPGSIVVDKGRIEALTDGVYAIAMTLAVLSIDVNSLEPPTADTLIASLGSLFDQLRHYVISFLTLGAFWIGQHLQFEQLKAVDMKYVWNCLFNLLFITLIPFTTALTAKFSGVALSIQCFAANMFFISLTSLMGWRYISSHRHLLKEDVDMNAISRTGNMLVVTPMLSVAVFIAAWIIPGWATALFILIPLLHRRLR